MGKWEKKPRYIYSTREVKGLEHLVGKAIIQFQKNFRVSYLRPKNFEDKLLLVALKEQRMTIGDFPGYNSVLISYRKLHTIIRKLNPSWKSALSSVSSIYLIADTMEGKQYVGSAYGSEGIWQRWRQYVKNGHGGNKELCDLLNKKNENYSDNFQFSLLEICDLNSNNEYVIKRENHWKNTLMSRKFGLNIN